MSDAKIHDTICGCMPPRTCERHAREKAEMVDKLEKQVEQGIAAASDTLARYDARVAAESDIRRLEVEKKTAAARADFFRKLSQRPWRTQNGWELYGWAYYQALAEVRRIQDWISDAKFALDVANKPPPFDPEKIADDKFAAQVEAWTVKPPEKYEYTIEAHDADGNLLADSTIPVEVEKKSEEVLVDLPQQVTEKAFFGVDGIVHIPRSRLRQFYAGMTTKELRAHIKAATAEELRRGKALLRKLAKKSKQR